MRKGSLTVIAGCMSSGKSSELMRLLRRAELARRQVRVYAPDTDTRSGGLVASRDGFQRPAILVKQADDIIEPDELSEIERGSTVGIDEVQFFDPGIVIAARLLVETAGCEVVAAGLDTDFRGEPFGPMPQLLAVADTVIKLDAICVVCGGRATRSQRLIMGKPATRGAPTVMVGGDESYEARCRTCHVVPR